MLGSGSGSSSEAEFSGTLDIKTLGGAGFASQRTVDDVPAWDLSAYDALVLDVARADAKKYTVTLKDEVLPQRPDGREQSTVSWEYDFVVEGKDGGGKVVIPFADFEATYRGRKKEDAEPLDLGSVRRVSFMMRRYVFSLFSVCLSGPWAVITPPFELLLGVDRRFHL